MSLRLQTLAGYYHHSELIYDVGCDHGRLGLSFLAQPEVREIYLVDPSIEVINTLKKKLYDSYITKPSSLKVLHQKGQDLILNPGSKTIFIAGMGGKEIDEILKKLFSQLSKNDRVVISPHRNILELRQSLNESGYGLIDELSLKEEGQFYQIIALSVAEGLPKVHPYGEKIWQGPVGGEYRESQIRNFAVHQNQLARAFVAYLKESSLN